MKRIHSFAAIAAAALGLAGCWSQPSLKTDTITESGNYALYEGGKDSLTTEITLEIPTGGLKTEQLERMRENLTAAVLGERYRSSDVSKAISEFKEAITGQYRKDNLELLKDFGYMNGIDGMENSEGAPMLSWENIIVGHFMPQYGNMCSYVVYEYNFTGGAHGTDNETGLVFDLTTGELLYEEDIFKDGFEEEMAKALTAHLKDSFENADDYEMLFVKEIAPNGNFYITDKGVTYLYGRYEIGPYVIGLTRVTVPWAEIVDLVQ